MLPNSPISVKIPAEDRDKIKALSSLLGRSENRIIRDCVAYTMHLLFADPGSPCPTNLVPISKHVLEYDSKCKVVAIDSKTPRAQSEQTIHPSLQKNSI